MNVLSVRSGQHVVGEAVCSTLSPSSSASLFHFRHRVCVHSLQLRSLRAKRPSSSLVCCRFPKGGMRLAVLLGP